MVNKVDGRAFSAGTAAGSSELRRSLDRDGAMVIICSVPLAQNEVVFVVAPFVTEKLSAHVGKGCALNLIATC